MPRNGLPRTRKGSGGGDGIAALRFFGRRPTFEAAQLAPRSSGLVPLSAPYLKGADVVLASDCSPFAFASFHETFLGDGKSPSPACPKLDDSAAYRVKLLR